MEYITFKNALLSTHRLSGSHAWSQRAPISYNPKII